MLTRIGLALQAKIHHSPFTNVYGVARTILALSTACTLLFTAPGALFVPVLGRPFYPNCAGPAEFGMFCLPMGSHHLQLARALAVSILALAAVGYRPRYTGVLHFLVCKSIEWNTTLIDGGDQIASILTLLLIPVTLTDDRVWHWSSPAPLGRTRFGLTKAVVALGALLTIRVQVAAVYFHAAIGKVAVEEWTDGTALYYWFNDPAFGAPPWMRGIVQALFRSAWIVSLGTWIVVFLEFALAAALFMSRRGRRFWLVPGVLLHVGIALVHGLVSFALVMIAALILHLRPMTPAFSMPAWAARWLREQRKRLPGAARLTPETPQ